MTERQTPIQKIVQGLEEENMSDIYQGVIDLIYFSSATNEDAKWSAHYFACAIKECMTHKDSQFIGKGYIWEKVSKGMKELGMPIVDEVEA